MKIIIPSVELWQQPFDEEGTLEHVARCARVCRQVTNPKRPAQDLCLDLIKSGHLSMFRHVTYYFAVPNTEENIRVCSIAKYHPFIQSMYAKKSRMKLIAINGQTWLELADVVKALFIPFRVYEDKVVEIAQGESKSRRYLLLSLIRLSISCTTQISTSREMNRVSLNNIVEQSTRYVNFGKRGGIAICRPHWYSHASWLKRTFARISWHMEEWMYILALKFLKPEDARGFLPLDAGTQVVYTYSVREWHHIMDLRLRETTGKAHPNAQLLSLLIKDEIDKYMEAFAPNYSV